MKQLLKIFKYPLNSELWDTTSWWTTNTVRYFNTSPPNNPDNLGYIGPSSWKKCSVGRWNLSYESITFETALREWFRKPAEFRAGIEDYELLHAPSDLHPEEDNEEAADGEDDEDVPVGLSTLIVTEVDKVDLAT